MNPEFRSTKTVDQRSPRTERGMEPTDPAEDWRKFLSSFPESFRQLASTELEVSGTIFAVHQDLLSLHSTVFSDLFASCSSKGSRPRVPLRGDEPADVLACLKLMYGHAKGVTQETELVSTMPDAVRVAGIAHKYAADLQLEACDMYLHKQVGANTSKDNDTSSDPKAVSAWGALQWIAFAEQHALRRTLASWELGCATF